MTVEIPVQTFIRGAAVKIVLRLTDSAGQPRSLTGLTYRAHMRPTAASDVSIASICTVSVPDATVTVDWLNTSTADWRGRGVWDLEEVFSGIKSFPCQGDLVIEEPVTR